MKKNDISNQRHLDQLNIHLGKLIPLLNDERVTDIKILSSGVVIVKYFKIGKKKCDFIIDETKRRGIFNVISSMINYNIDYLERPILEGVVPEYNCRIQGIKSPWVKKPVFIIRKPLGFRIPLEEWVAEGQLTKEKYDVLINLIKTRKNIIVAGATGSGKTTLVNSIIMKMEEFTPSDGFFIVEDTAELICEAEDLISLVVPHNKTAEALTTALRSDPDRIIFGELRYGETCRELLLTAWLSGHSGNVTTIHCGGVDEVEPRIIGLLERVIVGKVPDIKQSVDAFIYIEHVTGLYPVIKDIKIL